MLMWPFWFPQETKDLGQDAVPPIRGLSGLRLSGISGILLSP